APPPRHPRRDRTRLGVCRPERSAPLPGAPHRAPPPPHGGRGARARREQQLRVRPAADGEPHAPGLERVRLAPLGVDGARDDAQRRPRPHPRLDARRARRGGGAAGRGERGIPDARGARARPRPEHRPADRQLRVVAQRVRRRAGVHRRGARALRWQRADARLRLTGGGAHDQRLGGRAHRRQDSDDHRRTDLCERRHVPDQRRLLQGRVARRLRPGGHARRFVPRARRAAARAHDAGGDRGRELPPRAGRDGGRAPLRQRRLRHDDRAPRQRGEHRGVHRLAHPGAMGRVDGGATPVHGRRRDAALPARVERPAQRPARRARDGDRPRPRARRPHRDQPRGRAVHLGGEAEDLRRRRREGHRGRRRDLGEGRHRERAARAHGARRPAVRRRPARAAHGGHPLRRQGGAARGAV
ncbi:MAG: hypothetical protein AVDCRST_MAG40-968, partial [uncultured Gemmatimonadaceae bacterium]